MGFQIFGQTINDRDAEYFLHNIEMTESLNNNGRFTQRKNILQRTNSFHNAKAYYP